MNRVLKLAISAIIASAFLALGVMVFFDGSKQVEKKSAVSDSRTSPVENPPEISSTANLTDIATPVPTQATETPSPMAVIENPAATPGQIDKAFLRTERRRLAKSLLEEFRKPENAAPDWETTTHPALFLPNGKPIDPYMLPPLQLPAAMTIENPAIEITTDLQVSEWERLQDEFLAEVGGTLPNDPASRKIWIQAQRKNDEKFRLKFGTEAFLRQQMDAYRGGFLQK
jgi:hypothetical protein